jgi:carbonic anhydrase
LIDRIMIVVRGTANAIKRHYGRHIASHPKYREALIEASIYQNAAITAFDLQRELFAREDRPLKVVYGVCNVGTMQVNALPVASAEVGPNLLQAPSKADEIGPLADEIVQALAATQIL